MAPNESQRFWLFGASVATTLGPSLEPCLSEHQAAKRGGHCGTNLKVAFAHLAGHVPPPARPPRDDVWEAVLGPAARPLASWAEEVPADVDEERIIAHESVMKEVLPGTSVLENLQPARVQSGVVVAQKHLWRKGLR